MAKYCNWYTEDPSYQDCQNRAEPGKRRCAEHKQVYKTRRTGDLTDAEKEYIRKRDDHRCAECGAYANDVDHIVELARISDADRWRANSPSNLQLLCPKHHNIKTAKFRTENAVKPASMYDRSISARARKKRRMRDQGYGV